MGYKVSVNGEKVWESEGEAYLVDSVKVNNSRGEVTAIGSSNTDDWLDIQVHVRASDAPSSYLDIMDEKKREARQSEFEPKLDDTREGYVKADPETGEPMEDTRVPMKDEEPTPEPAVVTTSTKPEDSFLT